MRELKREEEEIISVPDTGRFACFFDSHFLCLKPAIFFSSLVFNLKKKPPFYCGIRGHSSLVFTRKGEKTLFGIKVW